MLKSLLCSSVCGVHLYSLQSTDEKNKDLEKYKKCIEVMFVSKAHVLNHHGFFLFVCFLHFSLIDRVWVYGAQEPYLFISVSQGVIQYFIYVCSISFCWMNKSIKSFSYDATSSSILIKYVFQMLLKPVLHYEPINMKFKNISLEISFKKNLAAFINLQEANLRGQDIR